ncbi:MAG: peptidoglycan binding domain-containing protein, partial [Eubacteriales bacterium]|nr:peptidoglycan binding domain-containing protein [Eubacteriales bacterium]
MSHKKHTALITGLVIAAALAAGYVVGANYYGTKRFLMHTTYNGVSTKDKSSADIEEEAKQKLLSRSITIKERNDKTETIDLSSVASTVTFETSPDQYLKEQNAWTWPLSLFRTTALTSKYTVALDTDKLASAVNSLNAVTSTDVTAPQDATIVLGSDGFTIQDEVEGDQINMDALLSAIESAVQDDSLTVDADKEKCYNAPSVTSDSADLKSEVDSLNALKSETITIDLTGATETLGWDTFSSWLSYADGAVSVNSDSLAAYVSNLASKYDTFQTTRSFTTTLDGVQSVGMGDYDSYGFEMDQDQTASLIAQTITAGQSTTIQPVWTYTAVQRTGTN